MLTTAEMRKLWFDVSKDSDSIARELAAVVVTNIASRNVYDYFNRDDPLIVELSYPDYNKHDNSEG